jgi:hypothetical protein
MTDETLEARAIRPPVDRTKAGRSDRANKRALVAHVEPEVYRAFKIAAAQLGLTTDLLMHICIARGLDDYNEPALESLCNKLLAARAMAKRLAPP